MQSRTQMSFERTCLGNNIYLIYRTYTYTLVYFLYSVRVPQFAREKCLQDRSTRTIANLRPNLKCNLVKSISDKPSPPKGPANVEWRTDESVELKWQAPDSDGGAPVTDYIVERREVRNNANHC